MVFGGPGRGLPRPRLARPSHVRHAVLADGDRGGPVLRPRPRRLPRHRGDRYHAGGAMGKITQLVFGALSPGNVNVNLMSANVTAAAAGSSADLLTDLKSGYLLGA